VALFTILFDKPFDYQKDFLLDESKRIAFRSGRQVGKTTCCAIKAIHHALNGEKRVVVILSPSLRQSSLMFRKVRAYLKHDLVYDLLESESNTRVSFKNGSEIHCLPGNNPDTVRGFSPTMKIDDEAAFIKDEVYVASDPSIIATKGIHVMTSTPFGKRGRFYQAFNSDAWSKYHIKSIRSPLITKDDLKSAKAEKTELEFKQEYEGEFLEEMDTYFPRDLVLSCVDDTIQEITSSQGRRCNYFLGVDCARYGLDETVYTLLEEDLIGTISIRKIISTVKKPLTDVIGRVKDLHKIYDFVGIYIDSSGLGAGAVDSLIDSGLPIKNLRVNQENGKVYDSVQFTLQNKEEIYKNLKLMMEQERITYPKHDKLIQQLCDMQYEFTEAGHLKLHHPDRGHDDFPDSLALACASFIKDSYYSPHIA